MSEIPEEVMEAARRATDYVLLGLALPRDVEKAVTVCNEAVETIARAIMADRLSRPEAIGEQEPYGWHRDPSFLTNFSLGPNRPENATGNPDEWTALYALPSEGEKRMREQIERLAKALEGLQRAGRKQHWHHTGGAYEAEMDAAEAALSYQSGNGEGRDNG